MNKIGMVIGVAVVATLAGCKDPDYKRGNQVRNEVKNADTTPAAVSAAPARPATPPGVIIDTVPATTPARKCKCPPGTKHTEPCKCGSPDCRCIVSAKPVAVADVGAPAGQEYTVYTVQNGDYLSKISKRFNVTIASIKRLNPSIKNDVVRVGQKIKLPGKIDVPAAAQPAAPKSVTKKSSSAVAPYTGPTKEYVVKNGDTLGSIAYGNGINIRQLKMLNSLGDDRLKIGQKLKIPAEKVVKSAAVKKPAAADSAKPAKPAEPADSAKPEAKPDAEPAAEPDAEPAAEEKTAESAAKPAEAAAKSDKSADAAKPAAKKGDTATYVVQEGDDMTGVSIRWGVSAAQIRELNNLSESDQLVPGQIIKLPADAQQ